MPPSLNHAQAVICESARRVGLRQPEGRGSAVVIAAPELELPCSKMTDSLSRRRGREKGRPGAQRRPLPGRQGSRTRGQACPAEPLIAAAARLLRSHDPLATVDRVQIDRNPRSGGVTDRVNGTGEQVATTKARAPRRSSDSGTICQSWARPVAWCRREGARPAATRAHPLEQYGVPVFLYPMSPVRGEPFSKGTRTRPTCEVDPTWLRCGMPIIRVQDEDHTNHPANPTS